MKHILIVEDDTTFAVMLQTWLSKKKFSVASVSGIAAAKKTLIESSVDLVLCDLRLPDGDGIDLLEWVSNRNVNVPLIVMTSYAAIPSAVQAMKLGARDYISKPVNPEDLLQKINEVFNAGVRTGKQIPVSESVPEETNYLEGQSEAARQLYTYVKLVAPTSMSVLINGASGTGKEYVAKRIHQLSKRSEKPFVAIDCGAIPKELAASEFFGHKKGSFTGAIEDKVGAFIEADGGTIFLDEIGNLSYDVQVQLLRVLQERRVKPIGTTTEVKVDVRLIAATNEDLKAAIKSGAFREDLYHRINEFTIYMPHLCERGEDIPLFANFFLDQANRELEKPVPGSPMTWTFRCFRATAPPLKPCGKPAATKRALWWRLPEKMKQTSFPASWGSWNFTFPER